MKKIFALICAIAMLLGSAYAEEINGKNPENGEMQLIELTQNITSIEEEAFEGVENATFGVWLGSYAHQWCNKHGVRYVLMDDYASVAECQVFSVEIAEDENGSEVIRCVVDTVEDCVLKVDILSDANASVIRTERANVEGQKTEFTIDILPKKALPEYFSLRAVLVNSKGKELCDPRINSRYTSSYEKFMNLKTEDFPEEKVIDYGSNGFSVVSDDVIRLNAPATEENGCYTLTAPIALKAGDMVLLNVNGTDTPVKAASVRENADGTVTIVKDEKVYLSDMYDVIKVSGVYSENGLTPKGDNKGLSFKGSVSFETVTVSYDATISVHADFNYSKEEDYFEADLYASLTGQLTAFLGEEIDTWLDNSSPKFVIYTTNLSIPGVDMPAYLEVALPLNIFAEVGGTASANVTYSCGFHYNPLSGWTKSFGRSSTYTAEIGGRFSIKFGPEISLNLDLFDAVTGRVSGQAGILVEGKSETPFFTGSQQAQHGLINQYHACYSCIDMDCYFDIDMRCALKYDISPTLSGTPVDAKINPLQVKLGDLYYSLSNDPKSILEGKSKFGLGVCPNNMYRTIIQTVNMDDEIVSDIPVSVAGENITGAGQILSGVSPMKTYLYPGEYEARAEFESGDANETFHVTDASQTVNVHEEEVTVEGIVVDEYSLSPIEGAKVTLCLPDGSVKTAVIGKSGEYSFEKLPAGVYSISASADDYETETISNLNFTPGSRQNIPFRMKAFMPDREIMMRIVDYMGEDRIQKLHDAGIDVSMNFTYYTSPYGEAVLTYSSYFSYEYDFYKENKELLRECQIALLESKAFPLTDAQITDLTGKIRKASVGFIDGETEFDNGFSMWCGFPINDVRLIFEYMPEYDKNSFTKKWSSRWTWDEMTYEEGRNFLNK